MSGYTGKILRINLTSQEVSTLDTGDYGAGIFTKSLSLLVRGTYYYYRATANNTAGWGNGSISGFLTKPDELSGFWANTSNSTKIDLEWVQSLQSFFWDEAQVNEYLQKIMSDAFFGVLGMSQSENVDMRMAAYLIALRRLEAAITIRGIFP